MAPTETMLLIVVLWMMGIIMLTGSTHEFLQEMKHPTANPKNDMYNPYPRHHTP